MIRITTIGEGKASVRLPFKISLHIGDNIRLTSSITIILTNYILLFSKFLYQFVQKFSLKSTYNLILKFYYKPPKNFYIIKGDRK